MPDVADRVRRFFEIEVNGLSNISELGADAGLHPPSTPSVPASLRSAKAVLFGGDRDSQSASASETNNG